MVFLGERMNNGAVVRNSHFVLEKKMNNRSCSDVCKPPAPLGPGTLKTKWQQLGQVSLASSQNYQLFAIFKLTFSYSYYVLLSHTHYKS